LAKLRLSAPELRARGIEIDLTLHTYILVAKQFEANQIEGAGHGLGHRNVVRSKAAFMDGAADSSGLDEFGGGAIFGVCLRGIRVSAAMWEERTG
jgi:hypothetical protein